MKKIVQKCKEVGVLNTIIGCVKAVRYRFLQKKYHFESWHLTPYELREYAQATVAYINSQHPQTVIDIGCGLGETISHIKAQNRIGIDAGLHNINTAKALYKNSGIDFRHGSFPDLGSGLTIDYLITLNFMHGSDETTWQTPYYKCASENDIKHFLVDVVPASDNVHCLDFSKILPPSYHLKDKMGPFLSGRYLLVYEKKQI